MVKIFLAALMMAVAGAVVFVFIIPHKYIPILPWMLIFFTATTLLIHTWQLHRIKKSITNFTISNMIATFLRLAIYIGFSIVFLVTHSENIPVFIVCIAIIYFVYSFLKIDELSTIVKNSKNR